MQATIEQVTPHVAEKIEPGAIMYSSWGYDQTNVDYYMVTRVTKSSCWIVPMYHSETPEAGYSPMAGFTMPLEVKTHSRFCSDCRHSGNSHGEYGCRGMYGEDCECKHANPAEIKPAMHRIRRYNWGDGERETISLTSYSGAYLWDGARKYASHYA